MAKITGGADIEEEKDGEYSPEIFKQVSKPLDQGKILQERTQIKRREEAKKC